MNKTIETIDRLTLLVRYGLVDQGDSTIFDTRTNLYWQQSSSSKQYTWKDAHTYCEKLDLAGYKDWRLPTIDELKSLIEKEHDPTICPVFECKLDWYWLSSSVVYSPSRPFYFWGVYFGGHYVGGRIGGGGDAPHFVRAVRSG